MSTLLGIVLLGFSLLFFAAPSLSRSGRLGAQPDSPGKQTGLYLLSYLLAAVAFGLGLAFLVR